MNLVFTTKLIDNELEVDLGNNVIKKSNIFTETSLSEDLIQKEMNKMFDKDKKTQFLQSLKEEQILKYYQPGKDVDEDNANDYEGLSQTSIYEIALVWRIKIEVSNKKHIKILTGPKETDQLLGIQILTSLLMQSSFSFNNIMLHHGINHKIK